MGCLNQYLLQKHAVNPSLGARQRNPVADSFWSKYRFSLFVSCSLFFMSRAGLRIF